MAVGPYRGKISNGNQLSTVFGSKVGFSDPLALLPAVMLENFEWILAMGHQVHFIFGSVPGFLGRHIEWLWLGFSVSTDNVHGVYIRLVAI